MCVCVHIFTVHTTTEPAASTYEQVKWRPTEKASRDYTAKSHSTLHHHKSLLSHHSCKYTQQYISIFYSFSLCSLSSPYIHYIIRRYYSYISSSYLVLQKGDLSTVSSHFFLYFFWQEIVENKIKSIAICLVAVGKLVTHSSGVFRHVCWG